MLLPPCLARFAPQLSGYMGASVGFPAGVVLKLRGTRASQTLECPILLSSSYQDWKVGVGGLVGRYSGKPDAGVLHPAVLLLPGLKVGVGWLWLHVCC